MSDAEATALALAGRTGLPGEMLYLREAFPRERWAGDLHPTAAFWLQMHGGFRAQQARMGQIVDLWRKGALDPRGLHSRLIPELSAFLQHLDGHHRIESGHYFPAMRRMEPRIGAGIDLLDRDHDVVHAHLDALLSTGRAFHAAVAGGAPDTPDSAARLADALDAAAAPLLRHLEDEEDIVIPLICLRGDPVG